MSGPFAASLPYSFSWSERPVFFSNVTVMLSPESCEFTVSAMVCMMASSPSCQILMVTGSVAVSLPGAAALPLWGALEGVWPQPASIPSARAALNKREIAFFMVSPPFSM